MCDMKSDFMAEKALFPIYASTFATPMNPQQLALLPESLFSFVTWSKSESAIHVDTGVSTITIFS